MLKINESVAMKVWQIINLAILDVINRLIQWRQSNAIADRIFGS